MSVASSSAESTQDEIIDACTKLRREWLRRFGDQTNDLNGVDVFVLGLVLFFLKADRLHVRSQDIAVRLATVFGTSSLSKFEISSSEEERPCLALTDCHELDPTLTTRPRIFYNCATGIELAGVTKPSGVNLRMIPFSSLSPALWRCGLVWCEPSDGKNTEIPAPLIDIRRLLATEWMDPLKLYEELQTQRDRQKYKAAQRAEDDFIGEDVERLKARIAELELSGLVRHRDLVAKAALDQRSRR